MNNVLFRIYRESGHDVPLPSARLAARLVARPDTGAEQHPGAGRIPAEAAKALHLLDYIGADYPPTVHDGKVMDAGEYREQQEFSAVLAEVLKALPDNPERNGLEQGVQALRQAIDQRRRVQSSPSRPASWAHDWRWLMKSARRRSSPRSGPWRLAVRTELRHLPR